MSDLDLVYCCTACPVHLPVALGSGIGARANNIFDSCSHKACRVVLIVAQSTQQTRAKTDLLSRTSSTLQFRL